MQLNGPQGFRTEEDHQRHLDIAGAAGIRHLDAATTNMQPHQHLNASQTLSQTQETNPNLQAVEGGATKGRLEEIRGGVIEKMEAVRQKARHTMMLSQRT